jgi:2'-5' RNA ligase
MRCFIAIDIDEEIKSGLALLQKQIADEAGLKKGAVKWVDTKTMHLTLKFLGEIKDAQAVEVCELVKQAAGENKAFDLVVESVGSFGGRSARILWVGANDENDNLLSLQNDIEEKLASAGWPKEARNFQGHLTLCRIKDVKAGRKLADIAQNYENVKIGSVLIDSVSVYQSELRPDGPVYTKLGNYKLQ